MWLQVNKETKKIEGYIESCLGTPILKKDCELVEVESIPQDWETKPDTFFNRNGSGNVHPIRRKSVGKTFRRRHHTPRASTLIQRVPQSLHPIGRWQRIDRDGAEQYQWQRTWKSTSCT